MRVCSIVLCRSTKHMEILNEYLKAALLVKMLDPSCSRFYQQGQAISAPTAIDSTPSPRAEAILAPRRNDEEQLEPVAEEDEEEPEDDVSAMLQAIDSPV
eukprot:s2209_g9.t1